MDRFDRQVHYLACPVTRTWCEEPLGWWTHPEDEAMHAWLIMNLHAQGNHNLQAAVAVDVVVATCEAKIHGSRQGPHALLDARLKELRRRHKQVRDLVPFVVSHEMRPD